MRELKLPTVDDRRSVALATACTAFLAVPNLGALFGKGEQTERYDSVITPPDYAFAVWAPIFVSCAVSTVGQCLPSGRGDPVSRRTGWPLTGAYAVNTAWSLAAQSDRFRWTPYLLPVAAGLAAVAHARVQKAPATSGLVGAGQQFLRGSDRKRPGGGVTPVGTRLAGGGVTPVGTRLVGVTPVSTGLLLGWTTLASAVNIVAARADRDAPRVVAAATAGLVAVAAGVAVGVSRSRRGGSAVALASGWGLSTLAARRSRPRAVRVAAALGAAVIGAAGARNWGRG